MEVVLQRKLRIVLIVIACVLTGGALCPAGAADVTVCTENLFNYGIPEDVQRIRYPERTLQQVRGRILRQEKALVTRMAACDIVAVQEVVGDEQQRALSALDRLGRLLSQSTGRRYSAFVADSSDVIRNGFLLRSDGDLSEAQFDGAHTSDPLPRIPRFGEVHWKRGPAELVVELRQEELRQEAGSPRGSDAPRKGRRGGDAPKSSAVTLRVISAHLKSKREAGSPDPKHEKWERIRVVEASGLLGLATRQMQEQPEELLLVAGDMNNDRGSPTQEALSGEIDPASLLSPRDCIDEEARLACDLPRRAPHLINLLDRAPDLRGKGSYRFNRHEELIDVIFASPQTARIARKPGGAAEDYDVGLIGRFGSGSDHLLARVTLHL